MPTDSSAKTNNNSWQDEKVRISAQQASSEKRLYPDTSIHRLHRRSFAEFYDRSLGNQGSPIHYRYFHPDNAGHTGLSLGYHVFDDYKVNADSVLYYNTTRPYTQFGYQLGSKLEQIARVMHTQNVLPYWNFAVSYSKLTSPGFYKIQRTNHDNAALSTTYKSPNERYKLKVAVVYNKEQQDENGGILSDSLLQLKEYNDRSVVPVFFQTPSYSAKRSPLTNVMREARLLLQHQYTLGKVDTTYNADSTSFDIHLTPRFSVGHRMDLGSERHTMRHLLPDSVDYASFGGINFRTNDSVFSRQTWFYFDNRLLLSGYFGPVAKQLGFTLGAGARVDQFKTDFANGEDKDNNLGTYVTGQLNKEAAGEKQWYYNAAVQLYTTGSAAGNFLANAQLGKEIGRGGTTLEVGFRQVLRQAPEAYSSFHSNKFDLITDLNKESITTLYATARLDRFGLAVGVRSYLLSNYIYLASPAGITNGMLDVRQQSSAFNLSQVWVNKRFHFGEWVHENEVALQQVSGNGPIQVPLFMARHQFAYESALFKNRLKVATGLAVQYYGSYKADGYSAIYNRFYYQDEYELKTKPELSAFFNFRIKRFRAYLSATQIQQLFSRNVLLAPNYPGQNFMIRFGFEWTLVN